MADVVYSQSDDPLLPTPPLELTPNTEMPSVIIEMPSVNMHDSAQPVPTLSENSPRSNGLVVNPTGSAEDCTQLNGFSENPTQPNDFIESSILESNGSPINCPIDNGFSEVNSTIRMLKSSENNSRRRSPRFVENGGCFPPLKKHKTGKKVVFFVGDPISDDEARSRWPWRYEKDKVVQTNGHSSRKIINDDGDDDDEKLVLNVKCHYSQAEVLKTVFDIGDCAYVKGPKGGSNYVGKILEFFETMDGEDYFRVQWFFRAEDTVIRDDGKSHDKKRLFFSTLLNDNLLDCIISKVKVIQIAPEINLKVKNIPRCDYYYDMKYSVDYSTFSTMIEGNSDSTSTQSHPHMNPTFNKDESNENDIKSVVDEAFGKNDCKSELSLLDMYSGCGGMSTGLCLGAEACGVDLKARWAVDIDRAACESVRLNHPETQIRNEAGEDFLDVLKEWDRLCKHFVNCEEKELIPRKTTRSTEGKQSKNDKNVSSEYEVEKIVDICYSDLNGTGKRGLRFQVRWVGYGPSDDTWEPIDSLSKCQERIRDFVLQGMKSKILPRPGDVDVICGGPPCQGISGYNRFRNVDSPLDDERNQQILVFMDVIDFLKPKYVLMENVVDILKFANGCLGRYAISRLVRMHYQTRVGIMAAGCYGLAQFRMRVFLWGARPCEMLPKFPLPTHDVVIRYGFPSEFERNVVAYDEGQSRELEKIVVLKDAFSDLPPVANGETHEKQSYKIAPETQFQKYIRSDECDMMILHSSGKDTTKKPVLYDHVPYPLNEDDYMRVCEIPKRKGACFRDLPGIVIGTDNVARRAEKPCLMPSGKPWAPDYAVNFRDGRSTRPFGRLWWDETVPTVFCFPDPHMRAILHPGEDRLLSVRECARLQGFHDHYKFFGKLKDRYRQVGNAVPVSVGRALGYTLAMAAQKKRNGTHDHLMTLPRNFSHSTTAELLSEQHQ